MSSSKNPPILRLVTKAPSYLWLLFTLWEYDSVFSAPSNTAFRGGRQMRSSRWSSRWGSDTGCCCWLAERVWRCCCRYCRCCLCCEIHANWIRSCSNERILPARTVLPSPFPPIKSATPPKGTRAWLWTGQGKIRSQGQKTEPKGKGGHTWILWMHRRWLWYIGQSRDRERECLCVWLEQRARKRERERESGRGMSGENWRSTHTRMMGGTHACRVCCLHTHTYRNYSFFFKTQWIRCQKAHPLEYVKKWHTCVGGRVYPQVTHIHTSFYSSLNPLLSSFCLLAPLHSPLSTPFKLGPQFPPSARHVPPFQLFSAKERAEYKVWARQKTKEWQVGTPWKHYR